MDFLVFMGAAFFGLIIDRILIFLDDPKDNIKYFENKKKGNRYVTRRR